jgi:hypothetical protein
MRIDAHDFSIQALSIERISMTRIVQAGSITSFFNNAVGEVIRERKLETTDATKEYLSALLTDFAKPNEATEKTLEKPLTLLLDEALQTPNLGDRFARLRTLGDGVLYGLGFFGEHFEARGVQEGYLVGIGSRAYESAGCILTPSSSGDVEASVSTDLFGELASKFATFVAVLRDLANRWLAASTHSAKDLLRIYERWTKTGDEQLMGALSTHGFKGALVS